MFIWNMLFKKKQIILIFFIFLIGSLQVEAMESDKEPGQPYSPPKKRPKLGLSSPYSTSSLLPPEDEGQHGVVLFQPMTDEPIWTLLSKANKGNQEAQNELVMRCFHGRLEEYTLISTLFKEPEMKFLSWENIHALVATNNLYAYFILNHITDENKAAILKAFPNLLAKVRRRAESGDLQAQTLLGFCYLNGILVPEDLDSAFTFLAASSKEPLALYLLGIIYRDGLGQDADDTTAFGYFMTSATLGYGPAQFMVGELLRGNRFGNNPTQQVHQPTAEEWVKRARANGDPEAQAFLGQLNYQNKNYAIALLYLLEAANQGHRESIEPLITMYEQGQDMEPNEMEALRWKSRLTQENRICTEFETLLPIQAPLPEEDGSFQFMIEELRNSSFPWKRPQPQSFLQDSDESPLQILEISQLQELHEELYAIEMEIPIILSLFDHVDPGFMITAITASPEIRENFEHQLEPRFLSIHKIDEISYLTIGEENVHSMETSIQHMCKVENRLARANELLKQINCQTRKKDIEGPLILLDEAYHKIKSLIPNGLKRRNREYMDEYCARRPSQYTHYGEDN